MVLSVSFNQLKWCSLCHWQRAAQGNVDVSDAVGTIGTCQFGAKWPRLYKKVVPEPTKAQCLQEAFSWPAKVKKNLDRIVEGSRDARNSILLSRRRLEVTSNFSGICSQSRGCAILESHGYGCTFHHKSFCEKTKQCQQKLARDFGAACIFKDQMHLIDTTTHLQLQAATKFEDCMGILERVNLNTTAGCSRHGGRCLIPTRPDLNLFGAPCVDDSSMGSHSMDQGIARKVTGLSQESVCVCARIPYLCLYIISHFISMCFDVRWHAVGYIGASRKLEKVCEAKNHDIREREHWKHQ